MSAARVRATLERWHRKAPWLVSLVSFGAGVASFALMQRDEALARLIALLMLAGWVWLLIEELLGMWLTRVSRGWFSPAWLKLVLQSLHQQALFFALPFLAAATDWSTSNLAFTGVAVAAALAALLDSVYLRGIAARPRLRLAFHAYCTFVVALVAAPLAFRIPTDRALGIALGLTAVLAVLTSGTFRPRRRWRYRFEHFTWPVLLVATLWLLRAFIPPAGLWVQQALITDTVSEQRDPGAELATVGAETLVGGGVTAFAAIRAPQGLAQAVEFDWFRGGRLTDRIPSHIEGGRDQGYRTWTTKRAFPPDPLGCWRVDVRTADGQLIRRLRFTVKGSIPDQRNGWGDKRG